MLIWGQQTDGFCLSTKHSAVYRIDMNMPVSPLLEVRRSEIDPKLHFFKVRATSGNWTREASGYSPTAVTLRGLGLAPAQFSDILSKIAGLKPGESIVIPLDVA